MKRKLLESIKIIKENLYDANGNMISDNAINIEDKDKCIRLLQDYDEKLRKLENNEPVYSKITCLKEKTLPYNIVDDVVHKRKKSYDITIPSKGMVKGDYTCLEYLDDTYHDNSNINNNESPLYTENSDVQTFLSMKKELELLRQQYLSSQQEIKELKKQIEYYKQIFVDRNEEHKKTYKAINFISFLCYLIIISGFLLFGIAINWIISVTEYITSITPPAVPIILEKIIVNRPHISIIRELTSTIYQFRIPICFKLIDNTNFIIPLYISHPPIIILITNSMADEQNIMMMPVIIEIMPIIKSFVF